MTIGLLGNGVASGQVWTNVEDLPGTRTDSSDSGSDQLFRPDISVDPAGNATAVWRQRGPDAIRVARYDAAAGGWSLPIDLALVRPLLFPVVVGDDLGNVVAAWTTDNLRTMPFTSSGEDNLIQVARYSAVSGTWAAPQTIARAGKGFQFGDVSIAGNGSGDVFLVWAFNPYGTTGNGKVQSARYVAANGTWSSPVDLSGPSGNGAPRVAMNSAGTAMASWQGPSSAQFARFTAASATWSSAAVRPNILGDERLKLDASGNAMVVGIDRLMDASFNVIGQVVKAVRYTASSASWSVPVTLSPSGQWCNRPDMTMDASGNAVAIFEFQDYPATSPLNGIHATRYTAASGTWAGANLIRDAGSYTNARITADATGNLTAVWQGVGDFAPVGIYAARHPAGGAWEAPIGLRRRFTQWDSPSLAPSLPVDGAGNVTVVWSFFDSPAAGSSLESSRWLATGQPTGPPGAPTNFGAAVSGNTLSLAWSAPSTGPRPTQYTLLGRLTAGGPVVATVPMGAGNSFNVTAPNGTFRLTVRASNASGTGPESATVTVTVPQVTPPPGPPSGLTASTTGSTVSFSWTPPSSGGVVTNYVLVAGLTPSFSVPFATLPLGPTPSFVVPGVAPGTYYVRVQAQNATGTSAASNEVTVTVAGATPPGAPTLQPPVVTGTTVTLTWSAGGGGTPTSYTLTAGVTPDGAPIQTVSLTGNTISFPNVPAGTYYLRLTATNAAGTSPPSALVMIRVP